MEVCQQASIPVCPPVCIFARRIKRALQQHHPSEATRFRAEPLLRCGSVQESRAPVPASLFATHACRFHPFTHLNTVLCVCGGGESV